MWLCPFQLPRAEVRTSESLLPQLLCLGEPAKLPVTLLDSFHYSYGWGQQTVLVVLIARIKALANRVRKSRISLCKVAPLPLETEVANRLQSFLSRLGLSQPA